MLWKFVAFVLTAAVAVSSGFSLTANETAISGAMVVNSKLTFKGSFTFDGFATAPLLQIFWNGKLDNRNSFRLCPIHHYVSGLHELLPNPDCVVNKTALDIDTPYSVQISFNAPSSPGNYAVAVLVFVYWTPIKRYQTFTVYSHSPYNVKS